MFCAQLSTSSPTAAPSATPTMAPAPTTLAPTNLAELDVLPLTGSLCHTTSSGNGFLGGTPYTDFHSVALSYDGVYRVVTEECAGLWRSANSGANWSEVVLPDGTDGFQTVRMDGTGQYMVMASKSATLRHFVYTSSDWGVSFTRRNVSAQLAAASRAQPADGYYTALTVAVSATSGEAHFVAGWKLGRLAQSTDGGATWSSVTPLAGATCNNKYLDPQAHNYCTVHEWTSCAMSSGGAARICVAKSGTRYSLVAYSADHGSTWKEGTVVYADGIPYTGSEFYKFVDISSDGGLAAAVLGGALQHRTAPSPRCTPYRVPLAPARVHHSPVPARTTRPSPS